MSNFCGIITGNNEKREFTFCIENPIHKLAFLSKIKQYVVYLHVSCRLLNLS